MTTSGHPRQALIERLEAMIRPLVEERGLVLYDLELGGRRKGSLLSVQVDRPQGHLPGQGISVGELVGVTREISSLLDVEDPISEHYELEVHSPGIERALRRPEHFDALAGAQVKVVLRDPIEGQAVFEGTLRGLDEANQALVEDAHGARWALPLSSIKRAHLVHQW